MPSRTKFPSASVLVLFCCWPLRLRTTSMSARLGAPGACSCPRTTAVAFWLVGVLGSYGLPGVTVVEQAARMAQAKTPAYRMLDMDGPPPGPTSYPMVPARHVTEDKLFWARCRTRSPSQSPSFSC